MTLIMFFSKTGNDYLGNYGWGIVYIFNKRRNRVEFRLAPPRDYLKTDPIWREDIEKLTDKIRGKMRQITMWAICLEEFFAIRFVRARIEASLHTVALSGHAPMS